MSFFQTSKSSGDCVISKTTCRPSADGLCLRDVSTNGVGLRHRSSGLQKARAKGRANKGLLRIQGLGIMYGPMRCKRLSGSRSISCFSGS